MAWHSLCTLLNAKVLLRGSKPPCITGQRVVLEQDLCQQHPQEHLVPLAFAAWAPPCPVSTG